MIFQLLRTGNLTTKAIAQILLQNEEIIKEFISTDQREDAILEIIKTSDNKKI